MKEAIHAIITFPYCQIIVSGSCCGSGSQSVLGSMSSKMIHPIYFNVLMVNCCDNKKDSSPF